MTDWLKPRKNIDKRNDEKPVVLASLRHEGMGAITQAKRKAGIPRTAKGFGSRKAKPEPDKYPKEGGRSKQEEFVIRVILGKKSAEGVVWDEILESEKKNLSKIAKGKLKADEKNYLAPKPIDTGAHAIAHEILIWCANQNCGALPAHKIMARLPQELRGAAEAIATIEGKAGKGDFLMAMVPARTRKMLETVGLDSTEKVASRIERRGIDAIYGELRSWKQLKNPVWAAQAWHCLTLLEQALAKSED